MTMATVGGSTKPVNGAGKAGACRTNTRKKSPPWVAWGAPVSTKEEEDTGKHQAVDLPAASPTERPNEDESLPINVNVRGGREEKVEEEEEDVEEPCGILNATGTATVSCAPAPTLLMVLLPLAELPFKDRSFPQSPLAT